MSKSVQAVVSVLIGAGISLLVVPWVVKAMFAYAHWVMSL